MKHHIFKLLAIACTILVTSCESYQIHGDLDGFWQVQTIENKLTNTTTDCKGDIYYSFQRDLVLLTYKSPSRPTGQIKEHYVAYFSHDNDSIAMTDFRIYLDKDATQAPLSSLEKFGLHDLYTTFHVEELNKKTLILNSEKARLSMRKY